MLAERFSAQLATKLLPRSEYRPYPTVDDREAWNDLPERLRAERIEQAEQYLNWDWPSLPATLFMEYARSGNRSNYEKNHFARRTALGVLVVAECIEDEGRFIDDIINGIWAICEESFWGVPAHKVVRDPLPNVQEPVIDLFAAETGGLLSWTLYLLENRLVNQSPLLVDRMRCEMRRRILDPYLERDDFWWMGFGGRRVNNWNPWCNSNCLTAFLLVEDDPHRRVAAVSKALRSLDVFIESYPADGGCDEGTSYWDRAGGSLFDCLEQLYAATGGYIDVFDEPLIQEIGRYLYRTYIDGDWFINFADGSARVSISANLVYRYGKRINDPKLMALGSSAHHMNPNSGVRFCQSLLRDLPTLFNFAEIEAATPDAPYVRDVWLPDTQVMAARQTDGGAQGLYVAAKGGHNAESHNHNDVGNFIVYLNGRPVLVDPGVETYTAKTFSPQRYEIWTMQSAYHNLPTVNSVQQQNGGNFHATGVEYKASDDAAEFRLDISGAYPPEAGIDSWQRTIRLNRSSPASVVIVDDFALKEPTADLWLSLMTATEPNIETPGVIELPGVGAAVHYDPGKLRAAYSHIPTDDPRLARVWKQGLYRVQLTTIDAVSKDVWEIKVVPLEADE